MCGSKSSSPAEKPTPQPTTNLVAVKPTEGTDRGRRASRFYRAGSKQNATMLTQEGM
jgi:hypothetical protein